MPESDLAFLPIANSNGTWIAAQGIKCRAYPDRKDATTTLQPDSVVFRCDQ